MIVDLFEVSCGPAKYWARALELHQAGLGLKKIAKALETNRMTARSSVRYAKALLTAGLSEPFLQLDAPPANPGRWRYQKRVFRRICG